MEMHGHQLLAVERYHDDTRHMIEFTVLDKTCPVGFPGEHHREFLSEAGLQRALQSAMAGEIEILLRADIIEGHIVNVKKMGQTRPSGRRNEMP